MEWIPVKQSRLTSPEEQADCCVIAALCIWSHETLGKARAARTHLQLFCSSRTCSLVLFLILSELHISFFMLLLGV